MARYLETGEATSADPTFSFPSNGIPCELDVCRDFGIDDLWTSVWSTKVDKIVCKGFAFRSMPLTCSALHIKGLDLRATFRTFLHILVSPSLNSRGTLPKR